MMCLRFDSSILMPEIIEIKIKIECHFFKTIQTDGVELRKMISSLKKISVKAYGKGNVKDILEWGTLYYNVFRGDEPNEFKIYFPKFFVNVRSIITMAREDDTFATDWKLSISRDDKKYSTLFEGNHPFCSPENIGPNANSIASCKIREEKIFNVNTNKEIKGKYIKFTMTKNSYNGISYEYLRLIVFTGFDIIGTAEPISLTCKNKSHNILNQILSLIILIC